MSADSLMGHIEVLIKKKTAVIPKCKVDPAVALTILGHIEVLIKKKTVVIPKCKVDPAVALTINIP